MIHDQQERLGPSDDAMNMARKEAGFANFAAPGDDQKLPIPEASPPSQVVATVQEGNNQQEGAAQDPKKKFLDSVYKAILKRGDSQPGQTALKLYVLHISPSRDTNPSSERTDSTLRSTRCLDHGGSRCIWAFYQKRLVSGKKYRVFPFKVVQSDV
ncbi:hypothetical protein Esti_005289 [Eimeria stiedai]